jgi:hypothetical protein
MKMLALFAFAIRIMSIYVTLPKFAKASKAAVLVAQNP